MIELKITVAIPTLGVSSVLSDLFFSISQQKKVTRQISVLIVLNGSTQRKYEDLMKLASRFFTDIPFRLVRIESRGASLARNYAIDSIQTDLLFFTDDDCVLDNELVLYQHLYCHQDKSVFAVGGGYHLGQNVGFLTKIYQLIQMQWLYSGLKNSQTGETSFLIGGNFSIKPNLAKSYQIRFNNNIVYGGSELEFFLKAEASKLKMILIQTSLLHKPKISFFNLNQKIFKQGIGKAIAVENGYSYDEYNFEELRNLDNQSVLDQMFLSYFSYIFWFGFFSHKKKYFAFFKFILATLKTNRTEWVQLTYEAEQKKKYRGDRF